LALAILKIGLVVANYSLKVSDPPINTAGVLRQVNRFPGTRKLGNYYTTRNQKKRNPPGNHPISAGIWFFIDMLCSVVSKEKRNIT
jgi:hypothetical protein